MSFEQEESPRMYALRVEEKLRRLEEKVAGVTEALTTALRAIKRLQEGLPPEGPVPHP